MHLYTALNKRLPFSLVKTAVFSRIRLEFFVRQGAICDRATAFKQLRGTFSSFQLSSVTRHHLIEQQQKLVEVFESSRTSRHRGVIPLHIDDIGREKRVINALNARQILVERFSDRNV